MPSHQTSQPNPAAPRVGPGGQPVVPGGQQLVPGGQQLVPGAQPAQDGDSAPPPAPEASSDVMSDTSSVRLPKLKLNSASSEPTPGKLRKYDNLGSEYKLTKYDEDFDPLPRLKDLGDGRLEKLPELERIKSLKKYQLLLPMLY